MGDVPPFSLQKPHNTQVARRGRLGWSRHTKALCPPQGGNEISAGSEKAGGGGAGGQAGEAW